MDDKAADAKDCSQQEAGIMNLLKNLRKLLYPFVTLSSDDTNPMCYKQTTASSECKSYDLIYRLKYVHTSFLYKLLLHCLYYQSANLNFIGSHENKTIMKDISQLISFMEVENFVMISNDVNQLSESHSSGVKCGTLFGINCDLLEKKIKMLLIPRHFKVFKHLMEDYLTKESFNIIGFTLPGAEFNSSEEGILSVANHIEKLKKDMENKRILLYQQHEYNSSLLSMVFNQLSEYGVGLQSLIMKHRFCEHPVMYLNYKIISMKTYLLKLRCIELGVLCNTYTSKSVPALKTLEKEMRHKKDNTENKLLMVEHKLSAYDNLDSKFKDLLKEYSTLQKDIRMFQSDFTNS